MMTDEIESLLNVLGLSLTGEMDWNEIWVNGWDNFWIEKHGTVAKLSSPFDTSQEFHQWRIHLQEFCQAEPSLEKPFTNSQTTGLRFHFVHEALGGGSPLVSIRRLGHSRWTLDDLHQNSWCDSHQLELIRRAIRARETFLVVGTTGAGKTTCLNACLKEASPTDRLVVIEDTPELCLPNALSVRLETRPGIEKVLDEIDHRRLLREALRMRPDRLVIGEVRSEEAADLVLALSTGHSGSFCTLHANSPRMALTRLEILTSLGAPHWKIESIRELIFQSIQWVLVCHRDPATMTRRLQGLHRLVAIESSGLISEQIA